MSKFCILKVSFENGLLSTHMYHFSNVLIDHRGIWFGGDTRGPIERCQGLVRSSRRVRL